MSEEKWKSYEEVATYLLNEFKEKFDLEKIEGKQSVPGIRSGTSYEIDAKGIREGNTGFIIIECRRYTTSRQNQEKVGALAYRIIDTGARGGIIVSHLGLQCGAEIIARNENIINVLLNEDSTKESYVLSFSNEIMIGLLDRVSVSEKISVQINTSES